MPNRHDWEKLILYVAKNSPRNVILIEAKAKAIVYHLEIQHGLLEGQYECFLIYDVALNDGWFAMAENMLRVEIGYRIKALDQGRFPNLWDGEIMHFVTLKAMQLTPMRVASPYISTNTLSSFFYVSGISLILFGVLFIAEATICEKGRVRWRSGMRNLSVKSFTRSGFLKFYKCFDNKIRQGKTTRKKYDYVHRHR
ncbi:hypothetical protein Fcan01_22696 [Folsomia candida]|uniref:Uncharacterized protein n=1 Tax=Folsomia candida TaxID=158441 RepID=A0A226DAV4_FOLCA|nr:hypothetical protein Fcan01_22696 [Folsomia candida]